MESFSKNENAFKTLDEMFHSSSSSSFGGTSKDDRSMGVGLVSVETFKRSRDSSFGEYNPESLNKNTRRSRKNDDTDNNDKNSKKSANRTNLLSFDFDQQTEAMIKPHVDRFLEEKETTKSAGDFDNKDEISFNSIGKDNAVDTSFLPDRKREYEERIKMEKTKREEMEQEEKLKRQIIEVVFSYWDGKGHRRSIHVQRNSTIGEFLEKCRIKLKSEFKEFARIPSSLMYIKEDVILPHSITFHELIKTKARGKTGPLFHFNVFDDLRTLTDVRKETTESHAGKVVRRQWYEKNKHVYPAYRWENYVPGKFKEPYSMGD